MHGSYARGDFTKDSDVDIKPIAKSDTNSAKILLDASEYRSSNNRAYYGIYHAISAIHALELLELVQKYCDDKLSN